MAGLPEASCLVDEATRPYCRSYTPARRLTRLQRIPAESGRVDEYGWVAFADKATDRVPRWPEQFSYVAWFKTPEQGEQIRTPHPYSVV